LTFNDQSIVGGRRLGLGYRPGFPQPSRLVSSAEGEPAALESVAPEPLAENAPKVAASREAGSAPRLEIEFADGCWPEPDTIEEQLPPVPEFDLRLLPEALRPIVEDVADRMQVPIDFTAVTAVMCLAGAVNRRALIQPKRADHGWTVVPNLWGGIVASPGQKKSPAIAAITAPLRAIECGWRQEQEEALADFQLKEEEAELALSAWRDGFKRAAKGKGERPERPTFDLQRPTARRLLTSDGTFEALHELLANNPAGLFVLRDELTGWLASLDRQGREEQRAFYLEAWNGDSGFTIDRIGRGSVHAEHCCISLFGGIQPSRLRSYLAEALADGPSNDGLMQRFQLLVWPDQQSSWTYRDRAPSAIARDIAESVFRRLTGMDADSPKRFRFDDAAQELFVQWLTTLETELLSDSVSTVMQAHLAKYRSLMPSLALLFALADGCEGEVPLRHAQQAAIWCEYLKPHARRVYSGKLAPERGAAMVLGKRLREGWKEHETTFSLRDVYGNDWAYLSTPDEVRAALVVLEDSGWVRKNPRPTGPRGGRPGELWSINPRIYGGGP
jgi:putative DNA primase/helicase